MLKGITLLSRFAGALAGLAFVVAAVIITYETCARYAGSPTYWAQDLAVYLMIAGAFLSQAAVMIDDGHVRVDLIIGALGPAVQKFLLRLTLLLSMIYVAVLTWYGAALVVESFTQGRMVAGLFRIPTWIPELAIPVGGVLLLLAMIVRIVDVRRVGSEHLSPEERNL